MAITVKHSKVSTIPDEADTSLVRPSDWNADHTLTGTIDIANGGTGQTTANLAFNALAPSQTGNTGKYLTTDGTDTSWSTNPLGTVTSVAASGGTGISVSGSPITTSGTLTITNTAPDQTVVLTAGTGISTSGTYPNFTITNTSPSLGGNVVGPASATDNAVARFDTTTGKLIQNSTVIIDDTGNVSGVKSQSYTGVIPTSQAIGTMWFDSATDTLNFKQNNITQQVGEELFIYGRASEAITDGQVIAVTGAWGTTGVVTFEPAPIGTTNATSIIGLATEPIAKNSFGRITVFGTVHDLDTASLGDGTVLWYDPTVVGGYTVTKPSAPNIKVEIGIVTKAAGGTNGSIAVNVIGGSTLGGTDSNVQLTSPTAAQLLSYSTTSGYWKNTSLASGTGISVNNAASGVITVTNSAPDQTVAIASGTGISVTGTYPSFTVTNTSPSSGGTVTSVTGTGTVSGISLSGTVTTTGSLTLGGTLDLSSPPTIGNTTANTINGTTITGTKFVGISGGTF